MKSTKAIKIDSLAKTVETILTAYSDEIIDATKKDVDEVAKETRKIIKNNAPKNKGDYRKSISQKITYDSLTERRRTVFADKDQYRLTHLLEYGHVEFNQYGGSYGRTRAFPHWSKGQEYAQKELPKLIEKSIKEIK